MKPGRSGLALVICAPSGAGKTTLLKRLTAEFPRFAYSVSCTTRAPRTGEVDGGDYHFISPEEFIRRREAGFFAEWAEVHGNLYGTPLDAVRSLLAEGRDVLFDIDVQGAAQLRETLPEAVTVFILPPSRKELERRLRGRGTESEDCIRRRLAAAAQEVAQAHLFDHCIVNADLEHARQELRAAYIAAGLAPARNGALLQELREEWSAS